MQQVHVAVRPIEMLRAGAQRAGHGTSDRALVNFIRHTLTKYDIMMDAAHGHRRNRTEQKEEVQEQVLKAIAQAYAHVPALATEARGQLARKQPANNIRAWRAN